MYISKVCGGVCDCEERAVILQVYLDIRVSVTATLSTQIQCCVHKITRIYVVFMFCCGLVAVDLITILQGYFTGTGAIWDCPSACEDTLMNRGVTWKCYKGMHLCLWFQSRVVNTSYLGGLSVDSRGTDRGFVKKDPTLKTESCHDANFVITRVPHVFIMRTSSVINNVGIMTTLSFQWMWHSTSQEICTWFMLCCVLL